MSSLSIAQLLWCSVFPGACVCIYNMMAIHLVPLSVCAVTCQKPALNVCIHLELCFEPIVMQMAVPTYLVCCSEFPSLEWRSLPLNRSHCSVLIWGQPLKPIIFRKLVCLRPWGHSCVQNTRHNVCLIKWCPSSNEDTDLLTQNKPGTQFDKTVINITQAITGHFVLIRKTIAYFD